MKLTRQQFKALRDLHGKYIHRMIATDKRMATRLEAKGLMEIIYPSGTMPAKAVRTAVGTKAMSEHKTVPRFSCACPSGYCQCNKGCPLNG